MLNEKRVFVRFCQIIILPKNRTTLQKRKKSSTFAGKIFKIMGRHRKFDASFKAKVAIAALQEKESLNSLATKYGLSPTVIQQWREELEQQAGKVFETPQEDKRELKQLKAQNERLLHKVGQLTIDCDFFAQACEDAGLKVR